MSITSKELSWIEDQLNLEELLIKKYNMAESMATDETIRTKMKTMADRHQAHFDKLMGYLN